MINYIFYPLISLNTIFKKRDSGVQNSCVYAWMYNGVVYYIGEGINNRALKHKNDELAKALGPGWFCVMIATGITKLEGCILEAYLLNITNRNFTKRGQMWDGASLINKQREYNYKGVSYEVLFEEYLNLDNGNNYWETFRRQIDGY